MTTAAIIVAAGSGTRAASGLASEADVPKQFADLAGRTVLGRALAAFCNHPAVDLVVTVINPAHRALYDAAVSDLPNAKLHAPVTGGATRQASVLSGLEALPDAVTRVLIHDAARPFVSDETISNVLKALDSHDATLAAVPATDTLKRAGADGLVSATVDRTDLWRAQTPQAFRLAPLLAAHKRAARDGLTFTDDAAIAEWAGHQVALISDSPTNVKITTAGDLAMAKAQTQMAEAQPTLEPRTGNGFDVHRFAPGDHVMLCGVRIDHSHKLDGHSDADVGLHALTDAILGALGDGDIGQHFPPSDEKWRGAASDIFLRDAASRVAARGGRITNVDVTLLCEAPKIGPHRAAMQAAIAGILGLEPSRVGVKATTTEQLGFTGRREGIAAMATATLLLPA